MSKSEYARLSVQMPDVVKVIREQVLDDAIEAVKERKREAMGWEFNAAIDEAILSIENLKNK